MATEVNATDRRRVRETLAAFIAFVDRHRWVVKVNTVNFFTEGMWNDIVLPHFGPIAEAVARLSEADMARLPAGELPPQQRDGDDQNLDGALQEFVQDCLRHRLENAGVLCDAEAVLGDIESERRQGGTWTPTLTAVAADDKAVVVLPKILMGLKKSHEIEKMSHFTARLAELHHLQKVIDLGSGKGYLGQYLHNQYGLDVIGVDSSDSNTRGALERSHKLAKRWKDWVKHSMNIQQAPGTARSQHPRETFKEVLTRRVARRKQMQTFGKQPPNRTHPPISDPPSDSDDITNMQQCSDQSGAVSDSSRPQALNERDIPVTQLAYSCVNMQQRCSDQSAPASESPPDQTGDGSGIQMSQLAYSSDEPVRQLRNEEDLGCRDLTLEQTASMEPAIPKAEQHQGFAEHLEKINVDSDENQEDASLSPISQSSTKPIDCNNDQALARDENTIGTAAAHIDGPGFSPVTAYVEPSTSLSTVLSAKSQELAEQNTIPFMLVGLHTCGDLAASTLRLFAGDKAARVLLNVGCCYQHLTEEFETEGWCLPPTRPEAWGFPMSQFLRSKGTVIMRPGRMLASMAADRIATSKVIPAMGLFYRSVLQVLLRDHYRLPTRSENVGKLAPKCRNFLEYARKALKKLKFDDSKLSDAEIEAYSDRFRPYFSRLQALNQLRVALSPTIEGVFMLDRLCYLQEQEGVHRAAVIRLFDPVTSPRCYGILATRK